MSFILSSIMNLLILQDSVSALFSPKCVYGNVACMGMWRVWECSLKNKLHLLKPR